MGFGIKSDEGRNGVDAGIQRFTLECTSGVNHTPFAGVRNPAPFYETDVKDKTGYARRSNLQKINDHTQEALNTTTSASVLGWSEKAAHKPNMVL